MILLDTDHLTILRYRESAQYDLLMERLNESLDDDVATSVVSVEEQLRGWLAEIHRCRRIEDQSSAYERLAEQIEFLANWPIIRFSKNGLAVAHRSNSGSSCRPNPSTLSKVFCSSTN